MYSLPARHASAQAVSLSLTWGLLIEGDAAPGGLLQSLVIVDQIVHLKQSVRIRIDFSYLINLDTTHTTTQPNLQWTILPSVYRCIVN